MDIREKADISSDVKGETSSRDTSSSNAQGVGDKNYVPPRGDLDQAYWYVHESNDAADATPEELRTLRRKIDFWIVPIMFCCYTMQFIDKVSLNVSITLNSGCDDIVVTRSVRRSYGSE